MFIAYQKWQNPSYMSGPRYSRRVYGTGETEQEALFFATHYRRNGEWWTYGSGSGHPNASDLSVEEVDDDEVDDDEVDVEEVDDYDYDDEVDDYE